MTLAATTRAAVQDRPFLYEALRAGVVNYTAVAHLLDVGGEKSAVVAALRRYAEDLPAYDERSYDARVTIQSGLSERLGEAERGEDGGEDENCPALLRVGDHALVPGAGTLTGVLVTGTVDAAALSHALQRVAVEEIDPVAAGFAGEALAIVVPRSDGPTAVRAIESALEAVPG